MKGSKETEYQVDISPSFIIKQTLAIVITGNSTQTPKRNKTTTKQFRKRLLRS